MFYKLVYFVFKLLKRYPKILPHTLLFSFITVFLILLAGKIYQIWDNDPDRGAIALQNGHFKESYSTPIYLQQGWSESDSLWFITPHRGRHYYPMIF